MTTTYIPASAVWSGSSGKEEGFHLSCCGALSPRQLLARKMLSFDVDFDLDALRGPATTEIDSPHLRGDCDFRASSPLGPWFLISPHGNWVGIDLGISLENGIGPGFMILWTNTGNRSEFKPAEGQRTVLGITGLISWAWGLRAGGLTVKWYWPCEFYGLRRDRRRDLHDLGCAFVREQIPMFFAVKAPRPNRQRIALTGPQGPPILPAVSTKQTVLPRGVRCPWFGSADNLSSLALTIPVADAEVWALHTRLP